MTGRMCHSPPDNQLLLLSHLVSDLTAKVSDPASGIKYTESRGESLSHLEKEESRSGKLARTSIIPHTLKTWEVIGLNDIQLINRQTSLKIDSKLFVSKI